MKRTSRLGLSAVLGAIALLSILMIHSPASAQSGPGRGGPFGLGIILGDPTGLTAKYWLDAAGAVDFHLAFHFDNDLDDDDDDFRSLVLAVDYLYHIDVFRPRSVDLPLYVGIGGKLWFWDNDRGRYRDDDDGDISLGVRIPLGIALLLKSVPLEFFLEIVPGLRILPGTDGDLDAGIGVRYYF